MPDINWSKNAVVGVTPSTAGFGDQRQAEESNTGSTNTTSSNIFEPLEIVKTFFKGQDSWWIDMVLIKLSLVIKFQAEHRHHALLDRTLIN